MSDISQPQKEKVFCYAKFDLSKLLQLAERIRGRPCACDTSQIPKRGASNLVIFLEFDDSVEWVFRAPCSTTLVFGRSSIERLLASEAATLKYIKEHSSIPVPEVYHYSSTYDNDIGVPYILMSKAAGHPLETYKWQTHSHIGPGLTRDGELPRVLTDGEKKKIMYQLGRISRQLSDLRFPTIGSLFEDETGYYIGECLSPGHIREERGSVDIPRGPFHTESDFYNSLATALHLHAEQLSMGFHLLRAPFPLPQEYSSYSKYTEAEGRWNDFVALGEQTDSSWNRLQYCLVSQLLEDTIIPCMVRHGRDSMPRFPLCHADISVQNLFVDNDLNISCVIDWANAFTAPPAQLLALPGLPRPGDLVSDSSLMDAFRSGFELKEANINVRSIEPDLWIAGQMASRFVRLVTLDAFQDYVHLEALWTFACGSATPSDEDDITSLPGLLTELAEEEDAMELAEDLAAEDVPESKIQRREKEYFELLGPERLAVAQKVALAAEMNPHFVADYRLWRWIDAVMEDRDMAGYNQCLTVP